MVKLGIFNDLTLCSVTGILPGHALLATAGCEAPGTT